MPDWQIFLNLGLELTFFSLNLMYYVQKIDILNHLNQINSFYFF
jgi:hypothetical protein